MESTGSCFIDCVSVGVSELTLGSCSTVGAGSDLASADSSTTTSGSTGVTTGSGVAVIA